MGYSNSFQAFHLCQLHGILSALYTILLAYFENFSGMFSLWMRYDILDIILTVLKPLDAVASVSMCSAVLPKIIEIINRDHFLLSAVTWFSGFSWKEKNVLLLKQILLKLPSQFETKSF